MGQNDKKADQLLGDHNYDGIQEFDNPMPRWWVNLFWATIIFSIGYCVYYLSGWGPTTLEQYAADREQILADAPPPVATNTESILEQLRVNASKPESVLAGKQIFAVRCSPCHAAQGQGLIGPNLTDGVWIHGGALDQIYKTVTEGVPDKGMIAWKGQLPETDIMNVIAFVRSIQNTNVPGKEPQGTPSDPTPLS